MFPALIMYVSLSGSLLLTEPIKNTPTQDSPIAKVKAKLDEVSNVVMDNKSMDDFIDFIKTKTRADVELDKSAFMSIGVMMGEGIITVDARDVKLRDGLNTALSSLGLQIGLVGKTIYISTEEGIIYKQMRQKVSVADGMLGTSLKELSNKTGANIVIDPRYKKAIAEAKCELDLSDVTLEVAVRLSAEVSGFRTIRMGNVLFVTTNERAKELRGDADGLTQPQSGFPGIFPPAADR
jgi:hypothetical protein